jgi:uncharacterized protein YacL
MNHKIVRIDFIFSYWLFFWFILYKLNITNYNPYLGLIIGLIVNTIMFILFLIYKNYYKAFLFFIVNFFIKIIPIYTLRNTTIQKKDIYTLFILYTIYLIYKYLLEKDTKLFHFKININNYKDKSINTPFMILLDNLVKNINNKQS